MYRKVVTVLFCDVVGSTALGETVDPEAFFVDACRLVWLAPVLTPAS